MANSTDNDDRNGNANHKSTLFEAIAEAHTTLMTGSSQRANHALLPLVCVLIVLQSGATQAGEAARAVRRPTTRPAVALDDAKIVPLTLYEPADPPTPVVPG